MKGSWPLTVNFSSRPLKLALVTRRYPPLIGGAEKVLSYLARALAAEGVEVTVVTSRIPGLKLAVEEELPVEATSAGRVEGQVTPGRLSVVRLATSRLRFWGTWRYMRHLKRWFQENPIDLAYVSMLKHDAHSVVKAGLRSGFPVVLRPEGTGATGDVAWQSWGNFGRTIGLNCRRADAFVTISYAIEKELLESWHSGTMRPSQFRELIHLTPGTPRVVRIPNGVPVPETAWQRRPEWRSAPRAVFVGRLAPEKGLDTLIDAWPLVRSAYPDAKLILFGEGPQRAALESKARGLGLTLGPDQAVDLPGATADSTEVLREADLFVLPSREEGMSIALLEAMALGIPLVASSIPGNRGLVSDFQQGRLVPTGNHERLAQVIIEQWDDLDRALNMGRAARNLIDREFSIETVARKHLALFHDIVANR
jgi:glycosyltransferase involved in cell wall biosynthesis